MPDFNVIKIGCIVVILLVLLIAAVIIAGALYFKRYDILPDKE